MRQPVQCCLDRIVFYVVRIQRTSFPCEQHHHWTLSCGFLYVTTCSENRNSSFKGQEMEKKELMQSWPPSHNSAWLAGSPASSIKLWCLLLPISESEPTLGYGSVCGFTVWFLLCACRVLESLLVSLTTTVVVFVASMVLGECRQMSSTSHTGNDTWSMQVRNHPWRSYVFFILFALQRVWAGNELLMACSTYRKLESKLMGSCRTLR